jgi:hypothetical protein
MQTGTPGKIPGRHYLFRLRAPAIVHLACREENKVTAMAGNL